MRKLFLFSILVLLLIACKTKKAATPTVVARPIPKDTLIVKDYKKPVREEEYSLDFKIGQMILIGLNNRTAMMQGDTLLNDIKAGKVGGVILFEKNIDLVNSKGALKRLIIDLQLNAPIPLFVSIDEEGGKVHRLKSKYGFFEVPSAAELGAINNTDSTFYYTKKLAGLLAEIGVNVNFAPDVDVALNPNNPVIAKVGRSYSSNPADVTKHALANIKAHHSVGVKTSLKHFPGHGSSMTDSHLGITDVTDLWNETELVPFRDIIKSGECDAIMTAHIVNRKLEPTSIPATMSKAIVTDLLRNNMGFNGVVFSDDMQMYAISKNYGLENAIKSSILAGVDVLVFGNNVSPTDRIKATDIHAIISKMVASGAISEERINESFDRIMALKEKKFSK